MDETRDILKALLAASIEQKAQLDGLRRGLAEFRAELRAGFGKVHEDTRQLCGDHPDQLRTDVGELRTELNDVRQELSAFRRETRLSLGQLGERWLQHDREIYSLKHPEIQG